MRHSYDQVKTDNADTLMNAIAVLWINLYYLEIYRNEQELNLVAKLTKAVLQ